jgi:radical SAM C-methyltransferase
METASMPLAMGYLKAIADADDTLRAELDIVIHNFGGGDGALEIVQRAILTDPAPDIVAFSVLGWNFDDFGRCARVFRDANPRGWVVFGGNHVSHQAQRTFGLHPAVDVIVNGEGELTFLDLLRARLAGVSKHDLGSIAGISFRDEAGAIVTTPDRERIRDLEIIPSPILTNTLALRDQHGRQNYDVVLLETNRGCPYKCSFCYWGGAIGQKMRQFSSERIAAELDVAGFYQIPEVVLCDSNFGMLREDEAFLDAFIKTREKHGFPRNFETSWAKNKGKVFYSIVRKMKAAEIASSFTLALQSLSSTALELMQRQNMKLNDWQDLAVWLRREGLDSYAEIIWGLPGETTESFLRGYDALAQHTSRIAIYPLLLMPNTTFSAESERFGFVRLRGARDDFDYVLSHHDMTLEDNKRMLRFVFWARVVAENQVLRYIFKPLQMLASVGQVEVLQSLDAFADEHADDPVSVALRTCRAEMVDHMDASRVTRGIQAFYLEPRIAEWLTAWWSAKIMPRVPGELRDFFVDLLDYDVLTRPIFQSKAGAAADARLPTTTIDGREYYVREGIALRHDIPAIWRALWRDERPPIAPAPRTETLYYAAGFATHVDNHEFVSRYVGKTKGELERSNARVIQPEPARATALRVI